MLKDIQSYVVIHQGERRTNSKAHPEPLNRWPHLVSRLHQAPHVDGQAVHRDGGGQEAVVGVAVDVAHLQGAAAEPRAGARGGQRLAAARVFMKKIELPQRAIQAAKANAKFEPYPKTVANFQSYAAACG